MERQSFRYIPVFILIPVVHTTRSGRRITVSDDVPYLFPTLTGQAAPICSAVHIRRGVATSSQCYVFAPNISLSGFLCGYLEKISGVVQGAQNFEHLSLIKLVEEM
jgi:hypothetical protein